MQKALFLTLIGWLFFCLPVAGQPINSDSLSLVSKINADRLKLDKLQNQLQQKAKNKQATAAQAQRSANKNSTAADKLRENPRNKKLARKANRKAGDAKRDARNARKAADRLDELNKDIQDLKERIANNQSKLNKYVQKGSANQ
jgi:hypothetical protein